MLYTRAALAYTLLSLLVSTAALAAPPGNEAPVTAREVLAMMADVPEVEGPMGAHKAGRFDRLNDAMEVAQAIAAAVNADPLPPIHGSRHLDAGVAAVFSAWESNNRRCAEGDHGRSWGAFQLALVHTSRLVACNPRLAAARWLSLAHESAARCAGSSPLSWLASGRCGVAVAKVRNRVDVARSVVGPGWDMDYVASLRREVGIE
jgi:hypothetical protein